MLKTLLAKLGSGGAAETDVASVAEGLRSGSVTVIDVREPDEWREGHIRGAVHIPLGSLATQAGTIDRSKPVVTICRSGKRSLRAAEILTSSGFPDVKSMAGGMIAWTAAHQPTTR